MCVYTHVCTCIYLFVHVDSENGLRKVDIRSSASSKSPLTKEEKNIISVHTDRSRYVDVSGQPVCVCVYICMYICLFIRI